MILCENEMPPKDTLDNVAYTFLSKKFIVPSKR
jgi:hypothetical protein